MKTRAYVKLGLALMLAIGSVFLARNWIQNHMQPVAEIQDRQRQIATTKVVVAASRLQFGNKIRREHLRAVDWPIAAVPEGSFKAVGDVLGTPQPIKTGTGRDGGTRQRNTGGDRVVLRAMEVNEPILKSKITGFGGRASLSTLIAPGMRATTISVNATSGVAGFVLPGDRVDVLLTRDPRRGESRGRRAGANLQTDVFLQNMKVLAIDQDADEDRNKPGVVNAVTLEVTTTQAQKLTLAQRLGSLSLALRHVNTVNTEVPLSIKAHDLRVGEANPAPDPQGDQAKAPGASATAAFFERNVQDKKAAATKRVPQSTGQSLSSIKIVRGLKSTEYEVSPEQPAFRAPVRFMLLDLPPSRSAPIVDAFAPAPALLARLPVAPKLRNPASNQSTPTAAYPFKAVREIKSKTTLNNEPGDLTTTEPIRLLKNGGGPGDN